MNLQQLLAILISVVLVNPLPLSAASVETSSPRPTLGSITTNGSVRVGAVQVPRTSTLFSGDQVQTAMGNAVVQYKEGPRVSLGSESAASFSSSEIQLQKGQMAFESSGKAVVFAASTLRLEPTSEKSVANVTVQDKMASVSVSQGSVRVMDPSGEQLAALNAGDARLFEKAAAPPPPAAPAAAPQIGSGGSGAWLIALGVGIVGVSLGIAGLVRANDASDAADAAQATASSFSTQITALQSSTAALSTQATSLSAQITALNTFATSQKAADATLQQLITAQANVNNIQVQIENNQRQIDALQTEVLAGGTSTSPQGASPQITSAQLAELLRLQTVARNLVLQLQAAVNLVNSITNTLNNDLSTARR